MQQTSAVNVSTFLMFEGKAGEAMSLYASVFPGFKIGRDDRYAAGEQGAVGTVKRAEAELDGHRLIFFDSFVHHAFTFTPAISLFVEFTSAEALDAAFAKLSDGGSVLMPADNYGFSRRFGWCNDRFGISWQLNWPETATG